MDCRGSYKLFAWLGFCHASKDFHEFELSGDNKPTVGKCVRSFCSRYLQRGKRNLCQNAHVHMPGTLTAVSRLSGYRWGALISSLQNKPKASSNHSALPPIVPVCHLLSLPWIPAFDRVQILPLSFILVIETPSWKTRKGVSLSS